MKELFYMLETLNIKQFLNYFLNGSIESWSKRCSVLFALFGSYVFAIRDVRLYLSVRTIGLGTNCSPFFWKMLVLAVRSLKKSKLISPGSDSNDLYKTWNKNRDWMICRKCIARIIPKLELSFMSLTELMTLTGFCHWVSSPGFKQEYSDINPKFKLFPCAYETLHIAWWCKLQSRSFFIFSFFIFEQNVGRCRAFIIARVCGWYNEFNNS